MADFVKLNGYNVKDLYSRNAVDNLNDELLIIYPLYNDDSIHDTMGDCTIIKSKNKAVMIDTYLTQGNWNSIKRVCQDYSITTFDYVIISHYHRDHFNNLQNLLADFDCTNTTFYIPRNVINAYIDVSTEYNEVITLLQNYNYIIIDDDVLSFDNVEIKLLNGTANDYTYLASLSANNYNDYCIVCELSFKDYKMLSLSDCYDKGQQLLLHNGKLSGNYDIVKDSHHAWCDTIPQFPVKLNPKYVVETTTTGMMCNQLGGGYREPLCMQLQNICEDMFLLGYQQKDIVFKLTTNNIEIINELSSVHGTLKNIDSYNLTLYVDYDNATLYRDGTRNFPFETINEALFFINKHLISQPTIEILSCNPNEIVYLYAVNNLISLTLNFNNNAIKQLKTSSNASILYINNLNVVGDGTNYNLIDVYKSDLVVFSNLKMNLNNSSWAGLSHQRSKIILNSSLEITNCNSWIALDGRFSHTIMNINSLTKTNSDSSNTFIRCTLGMLQADNTSKNLISNNFTNIVDETNTSICSPNILS